jgi:hypothetical protein
MYLSVYTELTNNLVFEIFLDYSMLKGVIYIKQSCQEEEWYLPSTPYNELEFLAERDEYGVVDLERGEDEEGCNRGMLMFGSSIMSKRNCCFY